MTSLASAPFAGIVFDMDGTLVDSSDSVERCWDELARAMGVEREHPLFAHGVPSETTVRGLLPDADEETIQHWMKFHVDLEIVDSVHAVPLPHSHELLELLDSRGVPWGIATSCTGPLADARHGATGLRKPEVFFALGRDYTKGKPDPDPFVSAATRLGIVDQAWIVVEDAPAGVASGRAAGAFVVAVTTTHDAAELGQAHLIVESLEELAELLDQPGMLVTNVTES